MRKRACPRSGYSHRHASCLQPKRWGSFWEDMGSTDVLALDMVEDEHDLYRLLAAISKPSKWAPTRTWCMHCKSVLGSYARAMHCRHCSRLVCGSCASSCLPSDYFPKSFGVKEPSWVCSVCEKILMARQEDTSNGTPPTTSSFGDDAPLSSLGVRPSASYTFEAATTSYEGIDAMTTGVTSSYGEELDDELFAC